MAPAIATALDGKDSSRDFEPWKKMVEERSGSFPAGVRWFLLNKLFQMRPAEIARREDVKNPHGVRGMIIRVSDQLRYGEISLFEKDPEEAEAAKARLEAKRAKRRERYAKNKDGSTPSGGRLKPLKNLPNLELQFLFVGITGSVLWINFSKAWSSLASEGGSEKLISFRLCVIYQNMSRA